MKNYQITDLEKLTGIKAHTIRIWEKRYNLIVPERTDTNYRRYNDDQVRKLLNVTTLMANGIKISKIAQLSDKEISALIMKSQFTQSDDVICKGFINELITSMVVFDEDGFEKTYASVINRYGIFDAMIKIIYPVLSKIGILWSVNDVDPAQEHFASCLIKRKLNAATDGLPAATNKRNKFLLLLIPNEYHDISLLFANYMIRSKGYSTIYLGQDVPFDNIDAVINETQPKYLLTFFTVMQDENEITTEFKGISERHPSLKLLVSGNPLITNVLKDHSKVSVLSSPNDLIAIL